MVYHEEYRKSGLKNRPLTTQGTVAAIATPPGRGSIGIIRISGDLASKIYRLLTGLSPVPNAAKYVSFRTQDGALIDHGIAFYFKRPYSFTGEDVVECQIHGSNIVLEILLSEIVTLGARLAKPGEFTERAFLNDKIDLLQAEAIADLIDSKSKKAARAAIRSLSGRFSEQLCLLAQKIIDIKALLEASLDFSEEIDLNFNSVITETKSVIKQLTQLLDQAQQGERLNHNLKVVIIGKPNVGKSSLLNYLSGQDAAIVSPIPGTTRDLVSQNILLEGIEVTLVDTAGIRETTEEIEREGVSRSYQALTTADLVLHVIDNFADDPEQEDYIPKETRKIIIRNKVDLCKNNAIHNNGFVAVSAKTGFGIQHLIDMIKVYLKTSDNEENAFLARKRHIDALKKAREYLQESVSMMEQNRGIELAAESQRRVLQCFDDLTGKVTSDDILGEIFSRFCIGK